MFKPSKATDIASYLAQVSDERRELVLFLHNFIKKTVPKLKSHFAHNMLGYGSFPYLNHRKEMIEWPVIALANQKNYISLYVCAVVSGEYIAERYRKELGKVSVGRSCIRFKRLDDLNLPVLKKVLVLASKSPGLQGVSARS